MTADQVAEPTDEEMDAALERYAAAVGKVAAAWNYLHEKLGQLFVTLLEAPDRNVSAAVWHSSYNDRAQRDMLRAVLNTMQGNSWLRFPSLKPDILWLLDCTNALSAGRDDVVHAPVSLSIEDKKAEMIAAAYAGGHRRVKNLKGKNLLTQFDWIEWRAITLARFAHKVEFALTVPDVPWPERPVLPDRTQKKGGQGLVSRQPSQE
jgi:hypothetical protein